jgi:hypothetical protein
MPNSFIHTWFSDVATWHEASAVPWYVISMRAYRHCAYLEMLAFSAIASPRIGLEQLGMVWQTMKLGQGMRVRGAARRGLRAGGADKA